MILIKGGRIIDPKSGTDAVLDLAADGGKISYIGPERSGGNYETVIDARGKAVVPGLIDAHVHFRDPGFTYKEDIESGAEAAARGGFTHVVCMANTKPAMDNPETLSAFLEKARAAKIRVSTVAAVTLGLAGKVLSDMSALKALGACGFSDDGVPLTDSALLREALRVTQELGLPLSLHEEDPALITMAGTSAGAPWVSEASMIARDIILAGESGGRVHFQHLSSAVSVDLVRCAKERGAKISAELTPHHFSLTEDAVASQGSLAKVNPPLRGEKDRLALIRGLREGVIDLIATDHAPHSRGEKLKPFAEAPSGMTGLETALALGITKLVRPGHLSLPVLVEKMSLSPARLYGFDGGYLAPGGPADMTILDPDEEWTVADFASKSANSPFIGQKLWGKVSHTIAGGKIVWRDGEKTGEAQNG